MESGLSLLQIQISPSLEGILRAGLVFFHALQVGQGSPRLQATVESIGEELRRSLGTRRPSELPAVGRTRRLYKEVGIDPTKERPSSEKLLRQVIRSRPFPRVNDFVDAMNLVSLRLQFPLGYYDWDQVVPPVLLRIGRPDERYPGTSGEEVRLQGKIALVDGEGPFGNPTRDSLRTRITGRTVRSLVIAFAAADTPRVALEEAIAEISAAGKDYCGGRVAASGILPL